jgi:hypothetical protein
MPLGLKLVEDAQVRALGHDLIELFVARHTGVYEQARRPLAALAVGGANRV